MTKGDFSDRRFRMGKAFSSLTAPWSTGNNANLALHKYRAQSWKGDSCTHFTVCNQASERLQVIRSGMVSQNWKPWLHWSWVLDFAGPPLASEPRSVGSFRSFLPRGEKQLCVPVFKAVSKLQRTRVTVPEGWKSATGANTGLWLKAPRAETLHLDLPFPPLLRVGCHTL